MKSLGNQIVGTIGFDCPKWALWDEHFDLKSAKAGPLTLKRNRTSFAACEPIIQLGVKLGIGF